MVSNNTYGKMLEIAGFYRESLQEANASNDRLYEKNRELLVDNIMLRDENEKLRNLLREARRKLYGE